MKNGECGMNNFKEFSYLCLRIQLSVGYEQVINGLEFYPQV